jgi:hypothetical protein
LRYYLFMPSGDPLHVFPDANIFLHFPALDGFDWLTVCETKAVVLHITHPVLAELNRVKDGGQHAKHVRKRAATIQRRLTEILGRSGMHSELTKGISIFLEPKTYSVPTDQGLNPQVQDDVFVAQILEFRKSTNADCVLITDDSGLGLMVKAANWRIRVVQPHDSLRLPDEADPIEKENTALRRKLLHLEEAHPDLKLTFFGGQPMLRHRVDLSSVEQDVKAAVEKLKVEHPVLPLPPAHQCSDTSGMSLGMLARIKREHLAQPKPSDGRIRMYNEKLEPFFQLSERIIRSNYIALARAVRMDLDLHNAGAVAATDVRVKMHFPSGFQLLAVDDIANALAPLPEPPCYPGEHRGYLDKLSFNELVTAPITDIHTSRLSIEESNSYIVTWNESKLRQQDRVPVKAMVALFIHAPFSFDIDYQLVAANLVGIARGTLHVITEQ